MVSRWCAALLRLVVLLVTAALGFELIAGGDAVKANERERSLSIYSVNTREKIEVVYKRDGRYVPEAMAAINHIMRDWRRDEQIDIDPKLIDLLWEVHREVGSQKPVYLVSGYRSPQTNSMLRAAKGGQARRSQHTLGKAIDVHFPDVPVERLRNSGLIRERGGVGYYPTSAIPFVHLDTGNVRHWPRLPRQELALLFPEGRSRHVPADGKPLSRQDFTEAVARRREAGRELPQATHIQLAHMAAPHPILASLGPSMPRAGVPAPAPRDVEAIGAPEARVQTASLDVAGFPATGVSGIESARVVSAPEYDEEHPDELYYQPFPLAPLLSEESIGGMDLTSDTPSVLKQVHMFMSEPNGTLPLEFEPGLQYAQLYYASRFSGAAVAQVLARPGQTEGDAPRPRTASASATVRQ
jgi:uncharacterized protein YcbK (DUF882 family)